MYEKDTSNSSKNLSTAGASKWSTEKERFLETTRNLELVKAQYLDRSADLLKNLNVDCEKSKVDKETSSELAPKPLRIKEKYIEPPKVTRVSRSFHGKSNTAGSLDIAAAPRRASDSASVANLDPEKPKAKKKFVSQLSQPCGSSLKSHPQGAEGRKSSLTEGAAAKPRFTTRIVDEAEHAASVGLGGYQRRSAGDGQTGPPDADESPSK